MLLPTKGIGPERALLTIGAEILELIRQPVSVSGLWDQYCLRKRDSSHGRRARITFDWFSLALAMLFAINAVVMTVDERIGRTSVPS